MESQWILLVGVMALAYSVCFVQGATYYITMPRQPSFDTEFTMSVSGHGIYGFFYHSDVLSLSYQGVFSGHVYFNKTLDFNSDGVQTWGVVFNSSMVSAKGDFLMKLHISGFGIDEDHTFRFIDNTGYICIQTDKPLYTPGQKVKFRVIALDDNQRMAPYPLEVEIKNPKDVVVDRLRYYPNDAFKAQEIDLPLEATRGNWTITAKYEGLVLTHKNSSRTFEVREYVLPRFTALVEVSPNVITETTELINVTVTSRYISGLIVKGVAEIQLGYWSPIQGQTISLDEPYAEQLKNGKLEMSFNVTEMNFDDIINEEKKRLIVNVTVTEMGTMETENVLDNSAFIVKQIYKVSFEGSRTKFKAGFNYTLEGRIRDAADRVVNIDLPLYLNVSFVTFGEIYEHYHAQITVDKNGYFLHKFKPAPLCDIMNITLSLTDETKEDIIGNTFNVSMLPPEGGQYLQISVHKPLTDKSNGTLCLQYTKPTTPGPITVLILSKGHLVYTTSVMQEMDGESFLSITSLLYAETLPFMRILAYYHFERRASEYFVMDSLKLPFISECKEELRIYKHFRFKRPQKPKAKISIFAKGSKNMHIGLVAVDKAVFALTEDRGLSRESIFELLASHDQGTSNAYSDDKLKNDLEGAGVIRIELFSGFSKSSSQSFSSPPIAVLGDVIAGTVQPPPAEMPKPSNVRRYLPESWLFEDYYLPSNGRPLKLDVTLPDSITTWSLMAVGISPTGGICLSKPIEQKVQKLLFANIRLPYKVTRLEEVKVKVIIFNQRTDPIEVKVTVKGTAELCFSSNKATDETKNSMNFKAKINALSSKTHIIKIIPLRSGTPNITVDVQSTHDRDILEKKLYVVAEGQRMRKTLTFVLDPEAIHSTFGKTRKKRTTLINTKTLKSRIFGQKKQLTKINLAMPKEYIKGTESCTISAFGDILADVINTGVVKSKSLMDTSLKDAEEVVGDLGPIVHVLLYANKTGLITKELRDKGQKLIKHSILRLLNYRDGPAFRLSEKSPKATWLTSVILKTLCLASPLAFTDKVTLIDQGFEWLSEQANENGSLVEQDWRLAKDSFEYSILLSAEALTAAMSCEDLVTEPGLFNVMDATPDYLEQNIDQISDVMVLAKVTYALTLYDSTSDITKMAVVKLGSLAKQNKKGHIYWANETVTDEKRKIPFWYLKGAKASSIEATAYALLVYLKHGNKNVDAIADWLIAQRNHQGVFVGALDSMAAIQALSAYSGQKHGINVALSSRLFADKTKDFQYSFQFTEKDAIHPKSFSNVPIGDVINVITKGQGLGQMHVAMEYNVPVDVNAACRYNVSIQTKYTQIKFDKALDSYPLCKYCDVDCPKPDTEKVPVLNATNTNDTLEQGEFVSILGFNASLNSTSSLNKTVTKRLSKADKILEMEKKHSQTPTKKTSSQVFSHSLVSLCLQVCIEYLDDFPATDTVVDIEMLTGYNPLRSDIERLEENFRIKHAYFNSESDSVVVRFNQLTAGTNCFTFRVVKEEDVRKQIPATVYIKEIGEPDPLCVLEYSAPSGKSLHVFCENPSNINRGECRCFSGLCSKCKPSHANEVGLIETPKMVCDADIGYQIHITSVQNDGFWREFVATVLSANKTSISHKPRDTITLTSPTACSCPYSYAKRNKPLYILTKDVEKMINRNGKNVYRYLLDENSLFLSVASPLAEKSSFSQVSHFALQYAFAKQDQCIKPTSLPIIASPLKSGKADNKVDPSLAEATYVFAQRLYQQVTNSNPNLVFSPYSIHSALSMASEGAKGQTQKEMRNVLGVTSKTGVDLKTPYHDLIMKLNTDQEVNLETANAMFANPSVHIKADFKDEIAATYFANVTNYETGGSKAPEVMINDYVSMATEGMVTEVVEPGSINANTVMILINTIFFKGTWKEEFPKYNTKQGDFFQTAKTVKKVDMMRNPLANVMYKRDLNRKLDVVELPFKGNNFGLFVVLPHKMEGLSDLEKTLVTTTNGMGNLFKNMKNTNLGLTIPKFKVETSLSLNKVLTAMGMQKAFVEGQADFSGMSESGSIYISDVIHKAIIEVTESGTTAAAVTKVEAVLASLPQYPSLQFVADHPFMYFLTYKPTGHILFQGKYSA